MARRPKTPKLMTRSLMHTAAKLHFLEGASQLEVARRMQVSTASVSRLLARAREEGIVRIHVADLDETDEMGDKLAAALQLGAVRVLESGKVASLATQVGSLLTDAGLGPGAVIAIGWGRTVQGVIAAGLPRVPQAIVVPAMGGMLETASHFQINEFVRTAAEQMQGTPLFLFAPSLPSPELRAMLLRDPSIARIMDHWSRVDAAILGIGDFEHAAAGRKVEFGEQDTRGVVGDVIRHYFAADGAPVDWTDQNNLVAIGRDQLRRIPLSIGVAIGREKAKAIIGAARGRMITALVTDTSTARLMLEHLEQEG